MGTGQSLKRFSQITKILVKHGFKHLLSSYKNKISLVNKTELYQRLRLVLEELGPTFVKFGQILSNRVDLLPQGLIKELQKLQFQVKSFDSNEALQILEHEWGQAHLDILSSWEAEPYAAASISQVHRAQLKDGRLVAIKIQRPHAGSTIAKDVRLMHRLANFFRLFLRNEVLDVKSLIDEFERHILLELNFLTEMRSLLRLSEILNTEGNVNVPNPLPHLCTEKVLVMDWVEGIHPLHQNDFSKVGLDPKTFVHELAKSYLKQVFQHGFYHADPHLGNILISPKQKIYLLDAGQVGFLYKKQRDLINEVVVSMVLGDQKMIVQNIWELCFPTDDYPPASFEQELAKTVERSMSRSLKEIDIVEFFSSIIDIFQKNEVSIPVQFYSLIKTMITLESVARQFDPEFHLIDWLDKNHRSISFQWENINHFSLQSLGKFYEAYKLLTHLPSDLRGVLKTFKNGRFQITLNDRDLGKTMVQLGKITNRLSASLIITGLILAGSFLIQNPNQPMLFGIPILAAPLFGGAILMGLWLLWSIWRSKTF